MPVTFIAPLIFAVMHLQARGVRPTTPIDLGPIETRNGRVVCLPFLRFSPSAGFLTEGQQQFDASIQIINDVRRNPKDLQQPSTLEEDQETQRLAFRYRKGLKDGLEASVEVPLLFRNGGFMDPIINWYHFAVLGPQNRVRDFLPFGRSFVRIPGVGDFGSAGGIGDITLALRKQVSPRFSIGGALKLPTGSASELLGSGAFDFGVNAEYQTMIGRKWQLNASLGAVLQGKPTVLKQARSLVDQESLAITYRKNSRDAFVAQYQNEASPTVVGWVGNDDRHVMLTFGYERRISDDQRLDFYFSEDHDLLPGAKELVNIAPDFTIGIRWSRRF